MRRRQVGPSLMLPLGLLAALSLALPSGALAQGVVDRTKVRPGNDSDVKLGSLNTGTVGQRDFGLDGGTIERLLEGRESIAATVGAATREVAERELQRVEGASRDVLLGEERRLLATDEGLAETTGALQRTMREFGGLAGPRTDLPDTGFD